MAKKKVVLRSLRAFKQFEEEESIFNLRKSGPPGGGGVRRQRFISHQGLHRVGDPAAAALVGKKVCAEDQAVVVFRSEYEFPATGARRNVRASALNFPPKFDSHVPGRYNAVCTHGSCGAGSGLDV